MPSPSLSPRDNVNRKHITYRHNLDRKSQVHCHENHKSHAAIILLLEAYLF
jgi:hypothetical protein